MYNEDFEAKPRPCPSIDRGWDKKNQLQATKPRRYCHDGETNDDGLEVRGEMHIAPSSSCPYTWLITLMIALRQKLEDSRIDNSLDVLFVAVAVYLWTDQRYVACLLTKSACYF